MKNSLLLVVLLNLFSVNAQVEDAWVYFKDKPLSEQYMANPLSMLSQKALERRSNQNIQIDLTDVPLHQDYVNQLKQQQNISIKAQSKWFNAVHIIGDISMIQALSKMSFVDKIVYANKSRNSQNKKETPTVVLDKKTRVQKNLQSPYGASYNQIQMLNGDNLHQSGYTGKGITIAIIDTGFLGVDTAIPFRRIRDNAQIKGGYDFVNRSINFYTQHDHGTQVLSCIAGYVTDQLVGTAPDADFYLFITEDVDNEIPLEESLWVEAAERADSLGVDIINTSLGYSTFDNAAYDYTYQDMDGKTSFIAKGVDIAFSKGMFCVVSAGNEGAMSWKYISTPADAKGALTVGAVDAFANYAKFSSIGPSSDGRIKPDVVAQGQNSVVSSSLGAVEFSNGTSFSSPIMAGAVACAWQALPQLTNQQLKDKIIQNASLYPSSSPFLGYGVPNFKKTVTDELSVLNDVIKEAIYFSNPVGDYLHIDINNKINDTLVSVQIYDINGRLIVNKDIKDTVLNLEMNTLRKGIYFIQLHFINSLVVDKFSKL